MEKKFIWVLKEFLLDDEPYTRPFTVAGCNWHILAYRKGDKIDGYLSLYLELGDPGSLPPGWRREVKFSLTLVNKGGHIKSNEVLGGHCCFDAKDYSWGCDEFVPLTKLHAKDKGFLKNKHFIISAEVHVLSAVVLPEESVKIIEQPLHSKEGTQAADASVNRSQGDSSCQVVQTTENAAKENLDVDGSSEENLDDDALKDTSHTVGNHVEAETEVSNNENNDAPKEDTDDEASSLLSNDGDRDVSSLNQVKSLEDSSQTVVNMLKEIQLAKETMNVNGFEVFSSKVESVSHIFKRHPDIALGFRPKNQQIRRAYMNELLSLIAMLCQSPEKLSEDDLNNADDTLVDLIDAGLKLDWLKTKLNEVSEKKKMEQGSGVRLQTMEDQLQKLKLMFLDLETQLQKEKADALAVRAPLSFNDVVC